jgi:hypothetical protein
VPFEQLFGWLVMVVMSNTFHIGQPHGLEAAILSALAYFEIFSHPLTLPEIGYYNQMSGSSPDEVAVALNALVERGLVHEKRGYYYLDDDGSIVENRISANLLAQKRMKAAWFYSSLIWRFPFVRAVFISGSLSKGVMNEDDDIDFFIVTAPGRLWITRVMLTVFKRVFLLNSHRNFCLNYFVDDEHLAIPDRDVFTASEIGLILPMYNRDLYLKFLKENEWYRSFYPNMPVVETVKENHGRYAGKLIERLIDGRMGDRIDDYCLELTRGFLARKYHDLNYERFRIDLESTKSVSKHHPDSQKFMVLSRYQEILANLQIRIQENNAEPGLSFEYGKSA